MATTIITKNGSGAPTADDLSVGELAVDLTNKRLYSKNSSNAVIELGVNAAADTTFGDNVKAIFGDGSDLQIYHDASDSIINDNGTGSLKLQQGGSTKLEVTTTGIDVTGTVTADGLTVDTDTLVVDAANNRVGIGTSSPAAPLSIAGSSTGEYDALILRNGNAAASGQSTAIIFEASAGTSGDEAASVAKISGLRTGSGTTGDLLFHTTLGGVSSEAMRIDSSGNVGINTTPKAWTSFVPVLQISTAAGGGGALAGTSADNFRMFANTYYDGSYKRLATGFATQYAQESGTHVWSYAASGAANSTFTWSEAARIDSSGNLLVGTTDTTPWDNSTATSADDGIFLGGGRLGLAKWGGVPLLVNRTDSDGDIAIFYKNGSPVGSIGTISSNVVIGTGNTGLRFYDGGSAIIPHTAAGGSSNGLVDLGQGDFNEFRDLYLSGGVYLGGTGAANKLDDYEEGTFTATLVGATSQPTPQKTGTGYYTKIGRSVELTISFENVDTSSYAGAVSVTGVPFANDYGRAILSVGSYSLASWSNQLIAVMQNGTTTVELLDISSGNSWNNAIHSAGTGRYLWINGVFQTDD